MYVFMVVMLAGLAGMVMMALPGLSHRGHIAPHGVGHIGHAGAHFGHSGHGPAHTLPPQAAGSAPTAGAHSTPGAGSARAGVNPLALLPSPRVVFTLMTLFGAFGYVLTGAAHMTVVASALLAVVPAVLVERCAVAPLWKFLFRFEGTPSTSLENLALGEATAVTPFHNGRGLVSVVHDGRLVQLRAELTAPETAMPVRVGDVLFIENVDVSNERITVSVK